jgi:hypothetical protein
MGVSMQVQRLLQTVRQVVPLRNLESLSNIDKHRTLNVIVMDLGGVNVSGVPASIGDGLQNEYPPYVNGQLFNSIVGAEKAGPAWHTVENKRGIGSGRSAGGSRAAHRDSRDIRTRFTKSSNSSTDLALAGC